MASDIQAEASAETHSGGSGLRPLALVVVVVCAALIGAGAAVLGMVATRADASPSPAEAGFARDMTAHHAQAVDMSTTVLAADVGLQVRTLAYDIITSQGAQRGMLLGWLQAWDVPATSSEPPMAWASANSMPGMDHATSPSAGLSGSMPGMASAADRQRLAQARGRAAEVPFLQLMIRHHQGGVQMAQAALDLVEDEDERRLAQTIVDGQTAEIQLMRDMLAERRASAL